jgi:hypothetical protein
MGVELGEAAPVKILLVGIGAGDCQIDVVQDAGIGRARQARRTGHQPFGERGDGARIVVVEERAVAAGHVVHGMCGMIRGRRIDRRVALLMVFGESFRNERGAGGGSGAQRRADQKRTAAFIMLGHE